MRKTILGFILLTLIVSFGYCQEYESSERLMTTIRNTGLSDLVQLLSCSDDFRKKDLAYLELRSRGNQILPELKEGLRNDSIRIRFLCANLIWALGDTSGIPILIETLEDKDNYMSGGVTVELWQSALWSLHSIRYAATTGILFNLETQDRSSAIEKYRTWWQKNQNRTKDQLFQDAMDELVSKLASSNQDLTQRIIEVFYTATGKKFTDNTVSNKDAIKDWWSKNRGKTRFEILRDMLKEAESLDKVYIATELALLGDKTVIPILIESLNKKMPEIGQTEAQTLGERVYVALKVATGEDFYFQHYPGGYMLPSDKTKEAYTKWQEWWQENKDKFN